MGWFKEQQDKPAEDREVTSSHLMALNSLFPTTMGRAEPVPYRGWILLSQEKFRQEKPCRWLLVVQGKTCLGELGMSKSAEFTPHKMERELHHEDSLLSFTKCICDHFFICCLRTPAA